MFETIQNFILAHESLAPWVIFFSIVLAGLNLPISIDLMLILVAILASGNLNPIKVTLFFSFFAGCCVSAWVSYSLGRFVGGKILYRFFSEHKISKIKSFLHKYGIASLLIGRFIPFGFRNCLFMTSGFSKFPFLRFATIDSIACFIWSSTFFTIFYQLGQNFDTLYNHLKIVNITIAAIFSITVIAFFCYKYRLRLKNRKNKS